MSNACLPVCCPPSKTNVLISVHLYEREVHLNGQICRCRSAVIGAVGLNICPTLSALAAGHVDEVCVAVCTIVGPLPVISLVFLARLPSTAVCWLVHLTSNDGRVGL